MSIKTQSLLISVSGTHGSGKTTIIEKLKQVEEFADFHFIESPTRKAKKLGLSINNTDDNYDSTQKFCLEYDLEHLKKYRNQLVIFDRSLFDTYIYSKFLFHQGQLNHSVYKEIVNDWELCCDNYDIFIIPDYQDIKLSSDGDRIQDMDFQKTISELFNHEIRTNKSISHKVLYISGSIETRLQQIFNKLHIKHEY